MGPSFLGDSYHANRDLKNLKWRIKNLESDLVRRRNRMERESSDYSLGSRDAFDVAAELVSQLLEKN